MKKISDRAEFFIFLLEKYAETKKVSTKSVLNFWKEKGVIDYINDMYELYHAERIENAIQDIERKCTLPSP
jgi:intein-encoded DNA endonuclease-like protein